MISTLCAFQVWIVYGDGSLGYSVAEFDTFTRHKVKSIITIFTFFYINKFIIYDKWEMPEKYIADMEDVPAPVSTCLLEVEYI